MIKNDDYEKVLNSGLTLDHYFLLRNLKDGVEIIKNRRVKGYMNVLRKKGYIDEDNKITSKGEDLIFTFDPQEPVIVKKLMGVETESTYEEWSQKLYEKCQEKLVSLIGKKQNVVKLHKQSFSFLPNYKDFSKNLNQCINKYKLKDHQKIEKVLLTYIEKCHDEKSWFPILKYYILKFGESQMVTDIENPDEENDIEYKSNQKFV